jgi:hypothetical protein
MTTKYSKFILCNDAFGVETVMLDGGITGELVRK